MAEPTKTRRKAAPRLRAVAPNYDAAAAKTVWLTFDDGPQASATPRVLDTLDKHGVRATFFVIGKHCGIAPAVLKRIGAAGHRIGNHTWSHPNLRKRTAKQIRRELERTEALIKPHVSGPRLFRPPFGAHNAIVDAIVAEMGYRLMLWNVETVDWSKAYQPHKWVAHGLAQIRARANSVVLMHDFHRSTADHLDDFLKRIKALGNARFGAPEDL